MRNLKNLLTVIQLFIVSSSPCLARSIIWNQRQTLWPLHLVLHGWHTHPVLHQCSECFEYPQNYSLLKSRHPKNTCQNFLPTKKFQNRKFQPPGPGYGSANSKCAHHHHPHPSSPGICWAFVTFVQKSCKCPMLFCQWLISMTEWYTSKI